MKAPRPSPAPRWRSTTLSGCGDRQGQHRGGEAGDGRRHDDRLPRLRIHPYVSLISGALVTVYDSKTRRPGAFHCANRVKPILLATVPSGVHRSARLRADPGG